MGASQWFGTRVKITKAELIDKDIVRFKFKMMEEGVFLHPSTHIDIPLAKCNSRIAAEIRNSRGGEVIGRTGTLSFYG